MITEKVTSFIPDAIREAGNTIAAAIQGGSGGSSVEWSQIITTGTKIATITIDEESTDVYAPAGGGGSTVSWNEIQQSGTKIAEITIDGTTYDVYAPNVSVSAADVSYNNTTSGLTATDAQEAIDELDAGIDTISGTVSGHTADIGNLQSAVASKTDQSMIAPVETVATASQAYAIGEQFILNGTLYTATAAITAGGTITIDGNCSASDTVTEQIEELHENDIGTSVTLTAYNTSDNMYTCPSDGYISATATGSGTAYQIRIYGANDTLIGLIEGRYNNGAFRQLVYVRKGMKTYISSATGSVGYYFLPIQ